MEGQGIRQREECRRLKPAQEQRENFIGTTEVVQSVRLRILVRPPILPFREGWGTRESRA